MTHNGGLVGALLLALVLVPSVGFPSSSSSPSLHVTAAMNTRDSSIDLVVTVDRPALGRIRLIGGGHRLSTLAHLPSGDASPQRMSLKGLPGDVSEVMWEVEARFRNYVFERYVGGPGRTEGSFMNPQGITVGTRGWLYVVDTGNDRVQCFDADYRYRFEFGGFSWGRDRSGSEVERGRFNEPTDIVHAPNRELYLVDKGNNRVVRLDREGRFLGDFGNERLRLPEGIAASPEGHITVTDTDSDRIVRFDPDGSRPVETGGFGWGARQFNGPCAATYDRSGNLYVVDRGNDRIAVLDPSLRPAFEIRLQGVHPTNVFVDDEYYTYVSDGSVPRVLILDNSFNAIHQLPSSEDAARLGRPAGIALSPDGRLHIVDSARNCILLYRIEQTALVARGKIDIASTH